MPKAEAASKKEKAPKKETKKSALENIEDDYWMFSTISNPGQYL